MVWAAFRHLRKRGSDPIGIHCFVGRLLSRTAILLILPTAISYSMLTFSPRSQRLSLVHFCACSLRRGLGALGCPISKISRIVSEMPCTVPSTHGVRTICDGVRTFSTFSLRFLSISTTEQMPEGQLPVIRVSCRKSAVQAPQVLV